jgi:5-(carboxyamino)imidazole ribonucleotide synthase
LKWSLFGYDGLGTYFLRSEKDLSQSRDFAERGLAKGARIYAEDFVKFRRELAMSAARDRHGDFYFWPLVVSEQVGGVCHRVWGPATQLGVSSVLENRAEDVLRKIMMHLDFVGVLTVEFFEDFEGQLWVNEVAPRVHNSAHYTQIWGPLSQFEAQALCVTGARLRDFRDSRKKARFPQEGLFMMQNLLGLGDLPIRDIPSPEWRASSRGAFVWYGKSQIRRGRKMGHWNLLLESRDQCDEAALCLDHEIKRWWSACKNKS